MSDAIFLEQRGIPSVPVGTETMMTSVGKGMARALGYSDFPGVVIPKSLVDGARYYPLELKVKWAKHVAPQIVKILTSK